MKATLNQKICCLIILCTCLLFTFRYWGFSRDTLSSESYDDYYEPSIITDVNHEDEEVQFPIAYGISVYKDYSQLHRLLRAIYRPFNLYCIHVDLKSHPILQKRVIRLTAQYSNIIIPQKFIKVVHSEFSVLESELLCMEALLKNEKVHWKYFINLTGQEWPLKTNLEIVRILFAVKGSNLMEKVQLNKYRVPTTLKPPHGVHLWKGAVHIVARRDFVKFALYDRRASELLHFLRNTLVPDETYFSTLNHDHSFRAPGGYSGVLVRNSDRYPFLNRYKIWETEGQCFGRFLREICIFSMKDVPAMIDINNKQLFANKFIIGENDDVLNFMEQWFYNRTKIVYGNTQVNPFINLSYYSGLDMVKNHF